MVDSQYPQFNPIAFYVHTAGWAGSSTRALRDLVHNGSGLLPFFAESEKRPHVKEVNGMLGQAFMPSDLVRDDRPPTPNCGGTPPAATAGLLLLIHDVKKSPPEIRANCMI